jgi:hypothetical protein
VHVQPHLLSRPPFPAASPPPPPRRFQHPPPAAASQPPYFPPRSCTFAPTLSSTSPSPSPAACPTASRSLAPAPCSSTASRATWTGRWARVGGRMCVGGGCRARNIGGPWREAGGDQRCCCLTPPPSTANPPPPPAGRLHQRRPAARRARPRGGAGADRERLHPEDVAPQVQGGGSPGTGAPQLFSAARPQDPRCRAVGARPGPQVTSPLLGPPLRPGGSPPPPFALPTARPPRWRHPARAAARCTR